MAKKSKIVQLAHRDLGLACIVENDEEAAFFLKGMREAAQTADRASERAMKVALGIYHR